MMRILKPDGSLKGRLARKEVRDNLNSWKSWHRQRCSESQGSQMARAGPDDSQSCTPSPWPPVDHRPPWYSPPPFFLYQSCTVPLSPKVFFTVTSAENLFSDHLLWLFWKGPNSLFTDRVTGRNAWIAVDNNDVCTEHSLQAPHLTFFSLPWGNSWQNANFKFDQRQDYI